MGDYYSTKDQNIAALILAIDPQSFIDQQDIVPGRKYPEVWFRFDDSGRQEKLVRQHEIGTVTVNSKDYVAALEFIKRTYKSFMS